MKLKKLFDICNYFDGVIGGVEVQAEHDEMFFHLPEPVHFARETLDHICDKYGLFVETSVDDDEHIRTFGMYV